MKQEKGNDVRRILHKETDDKQTKMEKDLRGFTHHKYKFLTRTVFDFCDYFYE